MNTKLDDIIGQIADLLYQYQEKEIDAATFLDATRD